MLAMLYNNSYELRPKVIAVMSNGIIASHYRAYSDMRQIYQPDEILPLFEECPELLEFWLEAMEWAAYDRTRVHSKPGLDIASIPDGLASELDQFEDYGVPTTHMRERTLGNAKYEPCSRDKVKSKDVAAGEGIDDAEIEKEVNELLTTFTALTDDDVRALDAMQRE